jgi:rhodanese-related sulfurtransferase
MKEKVIIKRGYILLSIFLIGIPVLLLILPDKSTTAELKPELLLNEVINDNRFVSTDFVAEKIINGDPHILLIDVRSPEEYNKFKLKNAINIPLTDLLNKDENGNLVWEYIVNQDVNLNVLYSNGTVYANQAWMLLRRLNFKNNYVMEGGLNKWVETIMMPKKPETDDNENAFALYEFRKAAALYFGGGGTSSAISENETNSGVSIPVKKEKKEKKQGGC